MTPNSATRELAPQTVLFAHYGKDWIRGSEQCLLDLTTHLDRTRFRPVVVCNGRVLAAAVEALGVTAIVKSSLTPASMFADRAQVRALLKIAEQFDAELLHVNTSLITPALIPVARKLQIPLLVHLHIVPTVSERRHELLHQASKLIGVSRASLAGFVRDGVADDKMRVIYNGVDGERLSRGDARGLRQQLGIADTAVTLGAVGSLIHRKGVDVVIEALHLLRARHLDVHLIAVGSGEELAALRELAAGCGVGAFAHFVGERADAGAIIRDAVDISVSAARDEAFPLNVIEAGYFGKPIVASDIPPHWEGIVNGQTGAIVASNSAPAFADCIATLVSDAPRRQAMGEAAKVHVRGEFSIARNVAAFERTYTELMARSPGAYGWLRSLSWPAVYNDWAREMLQRRVVRTTRTGQ